MGKLWPDVGVFNESGVLNESNSLNDKHWQARL